MRSVSVLSKSLTNYSMFSMYSVFILLNPLSVFLNAVVIICISNHSCLEMGLIKTYKTQTGKSDFNISFIIQQSCISYTDFKQETIRPCIVLTAS